MYWCLAQDWPLTAVDEELDTATIARMQDKWLERHDRETCGIMGILPLVQGLPMRLTAAKDKRGGAYKNAKCVLDNWELPPGEEDRIAKLDENEIILMCQPVALHLRILNATKHLRNDVGQGILRLRPEFKIWSRDGKGHARVRRKGFEVVPDFGGTAHAYCGDSLDAVVGDLLEWDRRPTLEAMQRAYIIKSRVRDTSGLSIVQPYCPALFMQGALPGPALLLQRQKGEINVQDLKKTWKRIEKPTEEQEKRWPWSMRLPCRSCTYENNGVEVWKDFDEIASKTDPRPKLWSKNLAQGEDLVCMNCFRTRFQELATKEVMVCDDCHQQLPRNMFPQKEQQEWQALVKAQFRCNTCQKISVPQRSGEIIACIDCGRGWPENHFNQISVLAWKEMGELAQAARCARCEAQQKRTPD